MKKLIATVLALVALAFTIIPSILVFEGVIDLDLHKKYMTAGTILWFITAPFWYKNNNANG